MIPVNVARGGGNQILSEVVESWIHDDSEVTNQPMGWTL